ncbi:hypothetical protein Agabi119p4_6022 [Agaricus bisporus var. burnettii]|uniref:Enoyl reductase (ER) domain-containing protein n=1 Tax=Agaricus bisporus var. burnettii TaxID=192524 RepID=A0A8H7F119_AGABI|nr:hypothetical protein Agabi119p4_6022 [Agaricus bisporus var. burnettii]
MVPPKEHKALYLDSKHASFAISNNATPKPGPGQLLIKVKAAGLNPIDWKVQKYGIFIQDYPTILGIDIAGDVSDVGKGVEGFANGDRVITHGIFGITSGGFQEYVLGLPTHTAKVPSNISYDQAGALPSTVGAAYLGLYNIKPGGLGFTTSLDNNGRGKYNDVPLLILGGATNVGQYAIQFAKLSGFMPIITTASLRHEDHLKTLGAHKVIDRHASYEILRQEVFATTSQPIEYILDAVSIPQTQQMAYDILAPGGQLQLVQAPEISPCSEKDVGFTKGLRSLPENKEAFTTLYNHLTELLQNGLIKPVRIEVIPGALAGVSSGLERLANDQISGVKLIVHPDQTV